jgi:hypothetical protein
MMPKAPTALPPSRLSRTLAMAALAAALALPALLPGLAHAEQLPMPQVPDGIKVPAGNVPYLLGHATGTQNYTCQPAVAPATGYVWTLVAPEATLIDDKGKVIMSHFGGPTWQANDGSRVVGALEKRVTVSPSAIDWLLLRAKSTASGPDGGDRLTATTFIHRVKTAGGVASADACNAGTVGAAVSVPYTSDYYFYKAANSD